MNWTNVADAFAKEAGIPRALRDPETLRRLADQLKSAPERERLAARSALLRTQAHARGRLTAQAVHRERAMGAAGRRVMESGRPLPSDMLAMSARLSETAQAQQTAGERSRVAGKALASLVEPRAGRFLASIPAGENEAPETFLRRYYGRGAETATTSAAPSAAATADAAGSGGGRSAGDGSAPTPKTNRNAGLALAAAALLGGGAYWWHRRRQRQEDETSPEARWRADAAGV